MPPHVPLSVLDLAPITLGSTAGDALRNSLDLARHAERLGYRRHWVAEHHNMPGIASAATAVVVGHLAAGTSTIRVGAGGLTGVDEIMAVSAIYDHGARLRSYEILADVR
jgi:alkanesulfonate monooxygenase SsuD/methylene tetrahydromethanopterin reductase-like flavin-dependent oxidoreductase (luciferase family)